MIRTVQKRPRRKAGKRVETRNYYLRYKLDWMLKDTWVSLRTSDKQAAEKKATDFIAEKEREHAGIIEPKVMREAARAPMKSHLEDFLADLHQRGKDGKNGRGAQQKRFRVGKLIAECGWTTVSTVTADSFVRWRSAQGSVAAKTLNDYLATISGLLNWMERQGRIAVNPLKRVEKVDERGKRKIA